MKNALTLIASLLLAPLAVLHAAHALQSEGSAATTTSLTGFNRDRVPLYLHFGKRTSDLTNAEIVFIANHSRLVTLEKSHGAAVHGSTEKGIADTARRLKRHNPDVKVLFYFRFIRLMHRRSCAD